MSENFQKSDNLTEYHESEATKKALADADIAAAHRADRKAAGSEPYFQARLILMIGAVLYILPRFINEVESFYCIAPWLYLICFLYFLSRNKSIRGIVCFGIIFVVSTEIRYYSMLGNSYPLISIPVVLALALVFFLPFLGYWLYQGLFPRHAFLNTLSFPLFRVGIEMFMYKTRLGQQNNLSLTQFDNKFLIQRASVVGEFGITFIVAWTAAVVVYLILQHRWIRRKQISERPARRTLLYGYIVILAVLAIHISGAIEYFSYKPSGVTVRMAAVTGDNIDGTELQSLDQMIDSVHTLTAKSAAAGAELMSYGEEAYFVNEEEKQEVLAAVQEDAAKYDMYILLTLEVWDDTGEYDGLERNQAILVDRNGEVVLTYDKNNLVPFIETGYTYQGTGGIPTVTCNFREVTCDVSISICYDGDFSMYVRQMSPKTDLYIDPSWDWDAIHDMHYRQIGLRAVENGVTVFKPTDDGYTTVTSPVGKLEFVGLSLADDTNHFFCMDVPIDGKHTVYAKDGWKINLLYILGAFGFIALYVCGRLYKRFRKRRLQKKAASANKA